MKTTAPAQPGPASAAGAAPTAEALLDALPWGVLALDEQGVVRQLNPAMARWCGCPPAALLGQPLAGAALPAAVRPALLQLLEPGAAAPGEVYLPAHEQWVAFSAVRQASGWVLYGQDTTAQKPRTPQPQPEVLDTQLPQPPDHYHALFHAMDQGFCVLEILFGETGQHAVDFRYLELNPAFARQSGMPAEALGRTARELLPDLEAFWFDTYGHVARTGATVRVEHYVPQVNRWFDVHAFRVGVPAARRVAVLFNDISERKQREAAGRASEEQQAFRLQLSDAIRSLTDPAAIQAVAAGVLGEYLGVDQAYYFDVDIDNDEAARELAEPPGLHRLGAPGHAHRYSFGNWPWPWLLTGETWVCHDVDTDPALADEQRLGYRANHVGAAVVVPLLRLGQLVATLVASQRAPRAWTAQEVALAEETLERTWVALERARAEQALARSEAKYRVLFDSIDEGFATVDVLLDDAGQAIDYRIVELNQAYERITGLPPTVVGRWARELVPDVEESMLRRYGEVVRTGEAVRYEQHVAGLGRWFDVFSSRVGGAGSRTVASVFTDITARKRREQHLAFLADLNVDFAPLLSAHQIMARVSEQLAGYLHLSRCHLAEVNAEADRLTVTFDWQPATDPRPPLLGPHRLADYLTAAGRQYFSAGHPLVLSGLAPNPFISTPPDVLAGMGFGSSVDIPLLIDGQWRFMLTVARAAPGAWRPDEVELLQQLATRIHTRLERAQAETALREAHAQLASVLERTHDAFYALDAEFRFTYVNERAAQLWGRAPGTLIGQVYGQAFPQAVGGDMGRGHQEVQHARQPAHFETVSPILGIWIEASIYPSQQGGVSVFFRDITARKRAEERQAFLLQLSDTLRSVTDPVVIQETVTHLARRHFGADRCHYVEIEGDDAVIRREAVAEGLPSVVGFYRLADFTLLQNVIGAGQPFVLRDVRHDAGVDDNLRQLCVQLQAISLLNIPVIKNGQPTGVLCLGHSTPRDWDSADVALAAEVADRTWAAVERARAEEARHASEQRLRAMMENLPGGAVFVVDAGLRYQVAEGAALRQLGLRAADFVGRTVQEMAPPDLWPDFRHRYQQALAGQPFEYEHAQGGRVFATRGGPLHEPDGTVAAVLAVSYDITARKQAEEALQESGEKYRALFDSIDEGYCIIEMLHDAAGQPCNWRFVEVNPAFEKNNGLANATGKTILDLVPTIEPQWFATYGRVAQTGQPLRFEEESPALKRWFSLYAFAVGAPGSHLVAVLFTDITARKQTEEALRLSEARLSLALQAGRMGSFEWTSEGNRITLSAMSEEVLGLHAGTKIGTSEAFFELVHPDDRARHQATFDEAGGTGHDFHSIYRVVRPRDGAVRWMEERGTGTQEPGTTGVCLRGVHWDVTGPVLAQQQLAEFNAKLEQRVARRTRELQASRDLLQSVFDTNLIAMSVQEAVRDETGAIQDFRLRLVSRELARETGRTDLVGKLYAQEYPGIRAAGIFDLAVRTVETGEPQGMEYHYSHEGFDKWFACQFVKLGDGIVATNLDITERRTAEQERLKNLRLLEQAEAVAGLGSWDYDLATQTLRWSDGMYQLFGRPVGSPVAPADYLAMVLPDDQARAAQLMRRLATGAGDFEETLRLRVHDQVKTVRMKAVVFHNEQQQAVRVLGVDLDISELQRLEHDNLRLRLRQQRVLFEAVQAAQEAERKRMADSLHNGIGQMLYATKLRLDQLHAPLLGTDPALAAARREADRLLSEAIRQTRALSHELVPMVLAEFGLATALQDVCRNMSTPQLRLRCQLVLDEAAAPLSPALQMALYRMAQELAQNIIRHAPGATDAGVELETMPGWVLLRAEDNGPGFAPVTADERPGLGLRSIRDRVALLGGQLETGCLATGGAYVRIRIPLPLTSPL